MPTKTSLKPPISRKLLVVGIDLAVVRRRWPGCATPAATVPKMHDPHSLGLVDDPSGNSVLDILLSDHADSNVSMTRLWLV